MAIDYHTLKHWTFPDVEHTYTDKDSILYALAIGLGSDPVDPRPLRYVYEKELRTLPTMAAVLGSPGFWQKDPATGIDWVRLVHGEQRLQVHQPLPPAGTVIGRMRVKSITDKGPGKGAIVVCERSLIDKSSGQLLVSMDQTSFCRGDGGYSSSGQPGDQPSDQAPDPRPAPPPGAPDVSLDLPTRSDMALLYRLLADRNPLHADPEVARAAGFERPILHGLALYGLAAHALVRSFCEYDARRLVCIDTRFSAPVYPGETVRMEMWRQGRQIAFRARVAERDSVVLNHGYAEIA